MSEVIEREVTSETAERADSWVFLGGTLAAGVILYIAKGLDLRPLGQFVTGLADTFIGLGLFVFLVYFGISVGTSLRQQGLLARCLGWLASLLYFVAIEILPAVGNWLTASVFLAKPMFSVPFVSYVQFWLAQTYYLRFATADSFGSIGSSYAGMFDNIDGLEELLGAIVSLILNIIPDYAMYWIAHGTADMRLGYLNFAVGTLYWFAFASLFMIAGIWGEPAMAASADGLARLQADEEEVEPEGPRARYAILRAAGGGDLESDPAAFFGYAHAALQTGRWPPDDSETFDTEGTAAGAAEAAAAAVAAGHTIVFGPLEAEEVRGAAPVLRRAGVPAITFTTSHSLLGKGIYSLAWSLEDEVEAVLAHARSTGLQEFVTLLPEALPEDSRQRIAGIVSGLGGRLVGTAFYGAGRRENSEALRRIGTIMTRRLGLLMIEPAAALNAVKALAASRPKPVPPQLLGAGHWFPVEAPDSALEGALFAAPAGYAVTISAADPAVRTAGLHAAEVLWLAERLDLSIPQKPAQIRARIEAPEGFELEGAVLFDRNGRARRELAVFRLGREGAHLVSGARRSRARALQESHDTQSLSS